MTRLALEDVEGKTNVKNIGNINNVSLGGVSLETQSQFEMGMTFKVSFTLPNGQEFKNLIGKVMWISKNPEKNFVGVRFTRFDLFDRIKLAGSLLEIMDSNSKKDRLEVLHQIVNFFKLAEDAGLTDMRLRALITESSLKIDFDKVFRLFLQVESASKILKIKEFYRIVSVFARVLQFLPEEYDPVVVKPELLKFKEEIELFESIKNNEAKYFTAIGSKEYEEAFSLLLSFCPNLIGITDKMLLIKKEEDEPGNANRISLLYYASVMYVRIADIYNIMEH